MLVSYTTGSFPIAYVPTVFDNYAAMVWVDNLPINLILWDTAGQEEYNTMRNLNYPDTDLFLVCFSIMHPKSLQNVERKWIPELATDGFAKHVPYFLIGTKSDLRHDAELVGSLVREGQLPSMSMEGEELAKRIGAQRYMECSALTQHGLKEVFDAAIDSVIASRKAKQRKPCCYCIIM